MPNGTYGGVRGRKTKVGGKLLLRFPPTRLGLRIPFLLTCFHAGSLMQYSLMMLIHLLPSSCCQRGNDIPSRSFNFIPVGV